MADKTYPPDAIRLSHDEIRLITLEPGEWSDDIRCNLAHAYLCHQPPYRALSYVWGSEKVTRSIILNGQPHAVTVNLESALRHLRRHPNDGALVLWIDALSINQMDVEERTQQVQMMGRIYQCSTEVIVYLGDGLSPARRSRSELTFIEFFGDNRDDTLVENFAKEIPDGRAPHSNSKLGHLDTCAVFSFIRTFSHDLQHLTSLSVFQTGTEDSERASCMEEYRVSLVESLRRLSQPPWTLWWSRIWVVQEVVVPRHVQVVYGRVSAPWSMFTSAANFYLQHSSSCCSKAIATLARDMTKVILDFSLRVRDIQELRSSQHQNEPGQESSKKPLLALLRRFRDRKASDPRDKIYALLSLAELKRMDSSGFTPYLTSDYALSEQMVFIQATLEAIYAAQSLSVLSIDLGRKCRDDLPSWVPDWGAPSAYMHTSRVEAIGLYDAGSKEHVFRRSFRDKNGLRPRRGMPHKPQQLHVKAMSISKIIAVGEVMWGEDEEACQRTIQQWWLCMHTDIQASSELQSSPMNLSRYQAVQAFWKFLCADVVYSDLKAGSPMNIRRTLPSDGVPFLIWTALSKRSPFSKYSTPTGGFSYWRAGRLDQERESDGRDFWHSYMSDLDRRRMRRLENAMDTAEYPLDEGSTFRLRLLLAKIAQEQDVVEALCNFEKVVGRLPVGRTTKRLDACVNIVTMEAEDLVRMMEEMIKAMDDEKLAKEVDRASQNEDDEMVLWRESCLSAWKERQLAAMDHSIMSATLSRRLFKTSDGRFGLCPANTRAGDELHIIKGAQTPFILRWEADLVQEVEWHCTDDDGTKHIREGEVRRTQVVGDCYVHDMMDWDKNNLWHGRDWEDIFLE